jgi:DNA repair exonuclease SbcCD ATPase subunit
MMSKPHLILNRLVVTGNGRTVYDESFHSGVNIIRGENSSGKSTICDMIFYVLGGENIEWTAQAASCDFVFAEFNISDIIICLRRELSDTATSIAIAEGSLQENLTNPTIWSMYGRMRSDKKESFSQFLFQLLGLPETKSDESSANITMYQVLRLLYSDQNTDNTSLFRRERQQFADRQDIRRSVGEMLLGIDDLRSHELRQELIKVSKLVSSKRSRLDSLVEAAMKTDPNFGMVQYSDMIQNAQTKQSQIEKQISTLDANEEESTNPITAEERQKRKKLQAKIEALNDDIVDTETTIQSLELNLSDSEIFIRSLESDLHALLAADKTREIIGDVTLIFCPICLSDVNTHEAEHCPLCKSKYSGDSIGGGRLRYSQEIKHQINESKKLYTERETRLKIEQQSLKVKIRERDKGLSDLRSFIAPTNRVSAAASNLLKEYGYLSRLIEDLGRLDGLKSEVDSLEKELSIIQSRLNR